MRPFTLAVLGCGSRGRIYAGIAAKLPEKFRLVAACDPVDERTAFVAGLSANPYFQKFPDAESFFAAGKIADALIVATQDALHFGQCRRALDLGYDLLLEKPIAATHAESLEIADLAVRLGRKVVVCHVLRYAPFYATLKRIVASGEIGDIVNFEAMEGVEPWHFAHSFVRGHWSRPELSSPTVVIKSSHDFDILAWIVGKPCEAVSAFGSLTRFRPENAHRADEDAGFYAPEKYATEAGRRWLARVYDRAAEATDAEILAWVKNSPWGRDVYACDNTAPDHVSAVLKFADGVTGTFTLTAFEYGRHYAFFGTKGVLRAGPFYKKISGADILVLPHGGGEPRRITLPATTTHGGDAGCVNALYDVLAGADDGLTGIAESLASHAMAFAVEQSRLTGKTVEIRENRF